LKAPREHDAGVGWVLKTPVGGKKGETHLARGREQWLFGTLIPETRIAGGEPLDVGALGKGADGR